VSNLAVNILEERLERITGQIKSAKSESERYMKVAEDAQAYYRRLVQEETDLSVALDELRTLQQEGLIRS
jgi:hypothetical protein